MMSKFRQKDYICLKCLIKKTKKVEDMVFYLFKKVVGYFVDKVANRFEPENTRTKTNFELLEGIIALINKEGLFSDTKSLRKRFGVLGRADLLYIYNRCKNKNIDKHKFIN